MDIGHPKYDPSLKDQPPLELPSWLPNKPNKKDRPQKSTPEQPAVSSPTTKPTPPPQKKEYFWPAYAGGIIAIAVIVFFGVRAASSLFDMWTDLNPSDRTGTADTAAAETASVAEPTTTSEQPPAEVPATATTEPEPEPTPAPAAAAIDPSTLKVRVLNGSGVSGAAATASDVLSAASIPVSSTGNAKKFSYSSTMIYYPTGKKEAAELVAKALADYSPQLEENAVADGYDALVVVGTK